MSGAEQHTIDIKGQLLEYIVRRSTRRQTMAISVDPDQKVTVTVPHSISDQRIVTTLHRRLSWIRRQQRAYDALPPPPSPRKWVAGETHRYLGRQYRLKLVPGNQPSVRLSGAFFVVTAPSPNDRQQVQHAMENWYRVHAEQLFQRRLLSALSSTTWLKLPEKPPMTIRSMRLRWGSATPKGGVCFNLELIKAPLGCVDYVIMHELVHLEVPNHGPAFWRLLSRCMPDWEKWKDRLAKQEI